jgi:hypothetical protein
LDLGTAKCRAITAPGLAVERAIADVPLPRAGTAASTSSASTATKADKNRAKKAKAKAKKEAEKAAAKGAGKVAKKAKVLAIGNGGVGDGQPKGQGKGRGKLMDKTPEGESICFKWSAGKPCASTPCPHKHICRKCGGPHKHTDPACPMFVAGGA